MTTILVTCVVGVIMNSQGKLQQNWLVNLQNTCGEVYDVDEEGYLVANSSGMYYGSMADYTSCMGLLGLYLGQIAFRYFGAGRLDFSAYTSKSGLWHQIIACILICVLYTAPQWLDQAVSSDNLSVWVWTIFVFALPRFIVGFLLTYNLPKLFSKIASYPQTLPELNKADEAFDPEKGRQVRTFQIKGKISTDVHVEFSGLLA